METKDHLIQTLDHFRKQRDAKLQEVRNLDSIIHGLEQELGGAAPALEPADSFRNSELSSAADVNGSGHQLHPDEFFSMTQTEAAKAYLKKAGRAISMDQLLDGMKRGGAHVGGADRKVTLYVSLMRNPKREFVRVGDGFIGLREFYPGLPKSTKDGLRKAAKARTNKRHRRVSNRTARNQKSDAAKPGKLEPPSDGNSAGRLPCIGKNEVLATIRKVLADGQLHAPEAIQKVVQQSSGFKVPAIVVYGCLRRREFEQVDGQYKLRK